MFVLPDDQINYVINCLTAKSTWDDLILYHEGPSDVKESRALLAKSKRFFKKGTQRFSNAKATDQTECYKFGKKGHFVRDCWSKASVPLYQSPFQPKPLSSSQHKPKLRPTKEFEAKYNKVKAKLALLSSSASASKAATIKNKGLIAEVYEWNEEEVSSNNNEMVDVKHVNNEILKENRNLRTELKELTAITETWLNTDDTKVSIPGVERPWLSESEGFILPNHDTGRKFLVGSQRNTTDPSFVVTDSSATEYDSADESSVCSTHLPPLKKLDGVELIFGPKTIKLILRSKSTFKAETLKGVKINEPSSAPAKGNKSSSTLKVNSAPAGKLKSVKIKDDPPIAIVIKELNDLKLQISKNQSSYSRNNQQRIVTRIISLEREINPRNPQHAFKRCEACGSLTYTTTDHCDIKWFKRGEALQAKKAEALKSTRSESSNANRSKTPTKRHMTGVKSYLHKYVEQPGPKVVFGDDSTCTTKGYGSIKCNGIVFIKFDEKRGTIFNSNKEVVMIAPRVRDVYVLDMTSSAQESFYIHNHKDHLGKFDEKADDGYLLGYSLVSKAFRVFNIRRQQTKETYHITFDESLDAIKFSKPSVDNINIAENERYPPNEYLHHYEPSQRYQTNSNDVSFIEPYECPEPVVLETKVSSDQNGQTDQND
ncbi:hypothetical protein Tco_0907385 [Tanacetum coccineum]|uniref:Retroviral polymerase SH3-like domain-containing protein n=1 Tax=Tanacetum coccineum TaxID=301880 RepID=A0ABQ5CJE7_9ASTR